MTQWKPVEGHILTRWAREVSPDQVLPEYPRPQLLRREWLNLNGLWDYAVAPRDQSWVEDFEGEILVPFAVESALSGVRRALGPEERLWYRRRFAPPREWQGRRLLLHFGAVDWEATVWLNGAELGSHRGGYAPFCFDVSRPLRDAGENELVVAVWDPSDRHWQQRGKQALEPKAIWYTAVSGIWQTVWLEPVPERFIRRIEATPDLAGERLLLRVEVAEGPDDWWAGEPEDLRLRALARSAGAVVAEAEAPVGTALELGVAAPRLWSPDDPHLYDLELELLEAGQGVDRVESYFAMREFHVGPDAGGTPRLHLNGEPLFQLGPLDQGYWPDGLYTAPTDEALRSDVEVCKRLGFNMIRKHVKVEPARYYHHCDRLGMIVWQDLPNGGRALGALGSAGAMLLGLGRRDERRRGRAGRGELASRESYWDELEAVVDALCNVPCIGMWVPFNEGWGQFDAARVARWLRERDPSRPVDHASGWFDQGAGDLRSRHVYFKRIQPLRPEAKRADVLSEFGGYALKLPGRIWNDEADFGYRKFASRELLTEAYLALLREQVGPWARRGLSGAVYTQTSDVELELNGYLTYDREVEKMDFERIARAHRELLEKKP